jgi:hypothetical protein
MDPSRRPAPDAEPHEGEDVSERGGDTSQDPRTQRAVPPGMPEKR